jgi:uncharacterized C2H2 Zn-finger protein
MNRPLASWRNPANDDTEGRLEAFDCPRATVPSFLLRKVPMGRGRIEMFQYRQVLVRLRAGDSVREIARCGLMGRDKLGVLRAVAVQHGWLDAGAELPDDAAIAAAVSGSSQRASSTISSVEPHREVVRRWFEAGVQGRAIHAALKREHAFSGREAHRAGLPRPAAVRSQAEAGRTHRTQG